MGLKLKIAAVTLLMLAIALTSGCGIDPMEQLTIDIQSQDVNVRRQAVLAMANLDDRKATEELLGVLEKDEELYDMAAVALVKKGRAIEREQASSSSNMVVDEVAKLLANAHSAESFRARAAWTLGEIGSRKAITALQGGSSATIGVAPALLVRMASTQALEKLGNFSVGRPFDIPMGTFTGPIDVLPQAAPLELPES